MLPSSFWGGKDSRENHITCFPDVYLEIYKEERVKNLIQQKKDEYCSLLSTPHANHSIRLKDMTLWFWKSKMTEYLQFLAVWPNVTKI